MKAWSMRAGMIAQRMGKSVQVYKGLLQHPWFSEVYIEHGDRRRELVSVGAPAWHGRQRVRALGESAREAHGRCCATGAQGIPGHQRSRAHARDCILKLRGLLPGAAEGSRRRDRMDNPGRPADGTRDAFLPAPAFVQSD